MHIALTIDRTNVGRLGEFAAGVVACVWGFAELRWIVVPGAGDDIALTRLFSGQVLPWQMLVIVGVLLLVALTTMLHVWRGTALGRVALGAAAVALLVFPGVGAGLGSAFVPSVALALLSFALAFTWRRTR